MAISYGLVSSQGNFGRVYDVTLASGDSSGTVNLTQTIDGVVTGMSFTPSIVLICPQNIVLTEAQVLAANGGAGSVGTYAGGAGTVTDLVRVTAISASAVAFASAATVLKSFRMFVGRIYQTHN